MTFYSVHERNPNDTVGGGGCVATGARKGEDCRGPWVNFFRVSTEFDSSPHSVICVGHLSELINTIQDQEVQPDGDELPRTGKVIRGTAAVS